MAIHLPTVPQSVSGAGADVAVSDTWSSADADMTVSDAVSSTVRWDISETIETSSSPEADGVRGTSREAAALGYEFPFIGDGHPLADVASASEVETDAGDVASSATGSGGSGDVPRLNEAAEDESES